jgi:hypothetical protein
VAALVKIAIAKIKNQGRRIVVGGADSSSTNGYQYSCGIKMHNSYDIKKLILPVVRGRLFVWLVLSTK